MIQIKYCSEYKLSLLAGLFICLVNSNHFNLSAAEKATIKLDGKGEPMEVIKFLKVRNELQIQVKAKGLEQPMPLKLFAPADVYAVFTMVNPPANDIRLDMADF